MFINKSNQINIYKDSIYTALLKKINNRSFSDKTLEKLVKISNTSLGLTKLEAKKVFFKNDLVGKGCPSVKLAFELKKALPQVSNDELRDKINKFIFNCNASAPVVHLKNRTSTTGVIRVMSAGEFVKKYSHKIGETIGKGGEAIVVNDSQDNNKVIKIFFDDSSPEEINNQVRAFEKFYGEKSAEALFGRAIHMDKIKGVPLSQIKEFPANAADRFLTLLIEMNSKGCPPSDLSENNFLYDKAENKFSPVDISLSDSNEIDRSGVAYLLDYIKGKSTY